MAAEQNDSGSIVERESQHKTISLEDISDDEWPSDNNILTSTCFEKSGQEEFGSTKLSKISKLD